MDSQKIYLLAEVTVLPEFLDDVKCALKQALIPTLQEAGCEGMFETSRDGPLTATNQPGFSLPRLPYCLTVNATQYSVGL